MEMYVGFRRPPASRMIRVDSYRYGVMDAVHLVPAGRKAFSELNFEKNVKISFEYMLLKTST